MDIYSWIMGKIGIEIEPKLTPEELAENGFHMKNMLEKINFD